MQLEAVCAVTMGHLVLEALGQVDDLNGLEGALLDAHTATNAERLRNEADLVKLGNFNTNLARLVHGARLRTLERALLGLALVRVDDRNSQFFTFHFLYSTLSLVYGSFI